jgi:hypothetical protein
MRQTWSWRVGKNSIRMACFADFRRVQKSWHHWCIHPIDFLSLLAPSTCTDELIVLPNRENRRELPIPNQAATRVPYSQLDYTPLVRELVVLGGVGRICTDVSPRLSLGERYKWQAGWAMTTVGDFNLRLSAAKDILVGLRKSELALVWLDEDELRTRARSFIRFLAEVDPDDAARPRWFAEVASSAEDFLVECLRSGMSPGDLLSKVVSASNTCVGVTEPRPWWRFWR